MITVLLLNGSALARLSASGYANREIAGSCLDLSGVLPLRRQLLTRDEPRSPADIVEQLAGMNAQTKRGPCVGLWTRTGSYCHHDYLHSLGRYDLIRANLMRGTVHLVTRRQYLAWRACLEPVAERVVRQYCPALWHAADREAVLAEGRELLRAEPGRTRSEIGARLAPRFPDANPRDLAFAVRMLLPIVEIADTDPWTSSRTGYVLAETVLDQPLGPAGPGAMDLAQAFFAAFGPATAADFRYWSGLSGAPAATALHHAGLLVTKVGRQQLLDIDHAHDAAVREAFVLPEFDNLLFCRKHDPGLAEAKRTLIYPPAQMHGCVMSGETIVAHWSAKQGRLSRSDWRPLQPAAAEEWGAFTRWYQSM